ncbi:MAG: hypothetical protein KME30_02090 [Iphinoe sp. HA4291-MV1]|jgi:hypothetical protein|nr:hypothetical protein [Iphinoe sp. HA4291-MV1]
MGIGQWAMGNGQWALGNGHWALGTGFLILNETATHSERRYAILNFELFSPLVPLSPLSPSAIATCCWSGFSASSEGKMILLKQFKLKLKIKTNHLVT